MSFVTGILLIVCSVLIGRALLPDRKQLRRSLWEELGIAYLLGTGFTVVVITAGFFAGLKLGVLWWIPLLAGIASFVLNRRRQDSLGELQAAPWNRPIGIALAVMAIGSFLATLALPLNEFDPLYHFAYRGKVLLYDGTPLSEAITGMIHPDGYGRMVTHPNYPFGIPILEAWVSKFGGWNDRWVQLPLALWAACLPMAIACGLRSYSNQAASTGAVLAAATPMLYTSNFPVDGWSNLSLAGLGGETIIGGGADLAVATMFATACALLLAAYRSNDRRTALCAALALAGAVMMKNEGLALAGVLLLATFLGMIVPPRRTKVLLPFAGIAIVGILPWVGLRAQLPAIDENYSDQMTVENVLHYLGGGRELVEKSPEAVSKRAEIDFDAAPARIGLVWEAFLEEFLNWRSWGILWLLAIVSLPFTKPRLLSAEHRWLTLLVLGGITLYFLILLVTPWNFPNLRTKGIPERLLIHLVGPILLLFGTASALGQSKKVPAGPGAAQS